MALLGAMEKEFDIKLSPEEKTQKAAAISRISHGNWVYIQSFLGKIKQEKPILLDPRDQGPTLFEDLLDLASKFNLSNLSTAFTLNTDFRQSAMRSLCLDESESFYALIHSMRQLSNQEAFNDFIKMLQQCSPLLNNKKLSFLLEKLGPLGEEALRFKMLAHITAYDKILDRNMSTNILQEVIGDLLSSDALTLSIISETLTVLHSAIPSTFDVYMPQRDCMTFLQGKLHSKGRLFFNLIVLKALVADKPANSLLSLSNFNKIFDLIHPNKTIYSAPAIHQFFTQLIGQSIQGGLTQSNFNELLNHLEQNKHHDFSKKSLQAISIDEIAAHFQIDMDKEIRQDCESLGENWWINALYDYLPEAFLARTQYYQATSATDTEKDQVYPLLLKGVQTTQSLLDWASKNSSLFTPVVKITATELYNLFHILPELKANSIFSDETLLQLQYIPKITRMISHVGLSDADLVHIYKNAMTHELYTDALPIHYVLLLALVHSDILSSDNYKRLFIDLKHLATDKELRKISDTALFDFIPEIVQAAIDQQLTQSRFDEILNTAENSLNKPNINSGFFAARQTAHNKKDLVSQAITAHFFSDISALVFINPRPNQDKTIQHWLKAFDDQLPAYAPVP